MKSTLETYWTGKYKIGVTYLPLSIKVSISFEDSIYIIKKQEMSINTDKLFFFKLNYDMHSFCKGVYITQK